MLISFCQVSQGRRCSIFLKCPHPGSTPGTVNLGRVHQVVMPVELCHQVVRPLSSLVSSFCCTPVTVCSHFLYLPVAHLSLLDHVLYITSKHVKSVNDGHFVSHNLFIYYLNQTHMTSKMAFSKSWQGLVWQSHGCFSIGM